MSGMKYLVERLGTPEIITAYQCLHPHYCADTKRMIEIALTALAAEGGLIIDADCLLMTHKRWIQYMATRKIIT